MKATIVSDQVIKKKPCYVCENLITYISIYSLWVLCRYHKTNYRVHMKLK